MLERRALDVALAEVGLGEAALRGEGVACEGCPPIERLFEQYAEGGGELLVCPICVTSRGLEGTEFVANARVAGATPLWEWIGDEPATIFSY